MQRGEALCEAFEAYRLLVPCPRITFEHAVFLVTALARGDEPARHPLRDCASLIVVDRLHIRAHHCLSCEDSPPGAPVAGSLTFSRRWGRVVMIQAGHDLCKSLRRCPPRPTRRGAACVTVGWEKRWPIRIPGSLPCRRGLRWSIPPRPIAWRARYFLPAHDARVTAHLDPQRLVLLGWFTGYRVVLVEFDPAVAGADAGESFAELRPLASELAAPEAALLGYARALSIWRANHRHCGRCGGRMVAVRRGHALLCTVCDHESISAHRSSHHRAGS